MQNLTSSLRQLATLGLILGAAACDANVTAPIAIAGEKVVPPSPSSPTLAQLELSPAFHIVRVGQSKALSARGLSADGGEIASPSVRWVASDSAVLSVDANGTTHANRAGVARVIALAGAVSDTATVASLGPKSLLTTAFVGGSIKAMVRRGETVSVPVVLDLSGVSSSGDLGSLQLDVVYDPALLRFESASSAASGASAANEVEPGRVRFAFAASEVQGREVVTLVTLSFKVSATAPAGAREAMRVEYRVPPTSTGFQRYEMPIAVGGAIQIAK